MKEFKFDLEGKNTLNIIETNTGIIVLLKNEEVNKPANNDHYYYIAFNVINGFFVFDARWHDSEMDLSLYNAGNLFANEEDAKSIADGFNKQLKIRHSKFN